MCARAIPLSKRRVRERCVMIAQAEEASRYRLQTCRPCAAAGLMYLCLLQLAGHKPHRPTLGAWPCNMPPARQSVSTNAHQPITCAPARPAHALSAHLWHPTAHHTDSPPAPVQPLAAAPPAPTAHPPSSAPIPPDKQPTPDVPGARNKADGRTANRGAAGEAAALEPRLVYDGWVASRARPVT
jgi:hypothetical protein